MSDPAMDPVLSAVFDSLRSPLAVLDEAGVIVRVNRAWRDFTADLGEGVNYLAACAAAADAPARALAAGLRDVLAGAVDQFQCEYPHHTTAEPRWFVVQVRPLATGPDAPRRFLVSHEDANLRKAAEALAQARAERVRELEQQVRLLPRRFDLPRAADSRSLREQRPREFAALVARYGDLLEVALERRIYKMEHDVSLALRTLAETMGEARAQPRDVIEVHGTALKYRTTGAAFSRSQAYIEEGRLLVLELMGHLLAHYRARALAAPAVLPTSPPPPGTGEP